MSAVPVSQFDRFTCSLAEEIKFRPSCLAASHRPDIYNVGRMKWENPLHALVIYNSPHGENLVGSTSLAGNDGAGEYLNTLFIAFFNAAVDVNNISNLKVWYILFEAITFNGIQ